MTAGTATRTLPRPSTHQRRQRPALLEQITGGLLGLAAAEAAAVTYGQQPSDRITLQVLTITRAYETATALTDAQDSGHFTGLINIDELITAAAASHPLDPRTDGGRESLTGITRALPAGLVRAHPGQRTLEAGRACDAPDPQAQCHQAAIAYAHLLAALLAGHNPTSAIDVVRHDYALSADAREAILLGAHAELSSLDPSTRPMPALSIAVWALRQHGTFLEILSDVLTTTGPSPARAAMVGGLLGARDGDDAVPAPWTTELDRSSTTIRAVAADLTWLHCHDIHGIPWSA